ncbi:molybdopterin synthase [Haloarcula onubensis]|uniref:Molybdopterin synthase n=1 Tax=Haloarcula onubensis TaxID=2950539 RepID=A0ABU2FL31_9EURY|nr:molybdopterin synthase [Halomicroarcula sp. S3CR25-11]MDS0281455.1 molybdopterin synthase [Halomicroarcula sp. S3CR25-11]
MQVLGIVGASDSGKTTLVERLVERSDGRVATVKHCTHPPDVDTEGKDTARHRAAGATETVALTDDGEWFATGGSRTLTETLDALAPDYDYAFVEGYSDAAIPKVVLGDREAADPVLARFDSGEGADLDVILDALAERDPYVTLETLVASVKRSPDEDRAGAIATFTGRVRARDGPEDPPTEHLEFERYDGVAQERMATLRADLEARDGVHAVALHHKTGVVEAGEDIVFVVVLAGHRGEAFAAVQDGINRLKDEVPLFKKEVTVDEEFWAHEREG